MLRSKQNQVSDFKTAVAIQKTKAKIAKAEAKIDLLEKSANSHGEEAARLRAEIAKGKLQIVQLASDTDLEGVTDEEIEKRFSESGL